MTLTEFARAFRHVREATGHNDGYRVEGVQTWSGGTKGQSWCAWMFLLWLDCWFRGCNEKDSPFPRDEKFGSCDEIYALAKEKGWLSDVPHVEDGYLFIKKLPGDRIDAHHVGLVTDVVVGGFKGIAGNTSEDGKSSNGTGVFEHEFKLNPETIVFVRYPR